MPDPSSFAETPIAQLRKLETTWHERLDKLGYGCLDGTWAVSRCVAELSALLTDLEAAKPQSSKALADALEDLAFARSSHLAWAEHIEAHTAGDEPCSQCDAKPYKLDPKREREWVAKYDRIIEIVKSHRVQSFPHRCSGCGLRWHATEAGSCAAELCGDCWRKVQPLLHGEAAASRPAEPNSLAIADWLDEIERALYGKTGNTFAVHRIAALRAVVARILAASPAVEGGREDELNEDGAVALLAAADACIHHLWDIAARLDTNDCNAFRDVIHRYTTITKPAVIDAALHGRAAPRAKNDEE